MGWMTTLTMASTRRRNASPQRPELQFPSKKTRSRTNSDNGNLEEFGVGGMIVKAPNGVSLIPEPLSVTGIVDGEVDRGCAPGSDIPEHTGLFE
jgi:hypothetical protein